MLLLPSCPCCNLAVTAAAELFLPLPLPRI
jgi:hypothetical protein